MQRRNQQHREDSEDQAEEVNEGLSLHSQPSSQEEEDGEDLSENADLDYQAIPELDRYEGVGIDDEYYELNPEDRKAAEQEIRAREWQEGGDDLGELIQQDSEQYALRKARLQFYEIESDGEQESLVYGIDPQKEIGNPEEWFKLNSTCSYIKRHLRAFLMNFRHNGKTVYFQALKKMCINNLQSMEVEYMHLREANYTLAVWIIKYPRYVLPEFNNLLYAVACKAFPAYKKVIQQCFFKLAGLPVIDKIRTLSYSMLDALIKVRGVVTSVRLALNKLVKVFYKCSRCGYLKGPFFLNEKGKIILNSCSSCHANGPFSINKSSSVYRNHQLITVQQSPSQVAPGRIPRCKQAVVFGDNIDLVKPGDEVEIIGIFTTRYDIGLNTKQGFPVFHTFIEVNSIVQTEKLGFGNKVDEEEFQKYSKREDFPECLYNSVAPSIYGHRTVKRAITLALFGGVQKVSVRQRHRTRGDLNILLLGDPGIAKSQFLKSVQKVYPRCVYTTGKGASAVGLTASVLMDKATKEWRLQAGALVLADKGVCLIDEFDKMSQQDRTSIHEAMQQQTISISKAGIVATLNARCSVIAAANPCGGCYNQRNSFRDNVELSEPILSRFDILCVIKDRPSEEVDGKLASFVIGQHMKNHPYLLKYSMEDEYEFKISKFTKQAESTDCEFIKQYIKYSKENYKPILHQKSSNLIKQVYGRMREFSKETGGTNIVARHLESMIRITEAHARMRLLKETDELDAKVAISTMLRSFIETQKHSTAERIKRAFKYDLLPEQFP